IILGIALVLAGLAAATQAQEKTTRLQVEVRDAATGAPLPVRVYLQKANGDWLHVKSADAQGSAVPYRKQAAANPASVEVHTTVSAHPFFADLAPGKYTLTIERGKEYHTLSQEVVIGADPVDLKMKLQRWGNMAERGWYAGDTHVHRTLAELPNVMLAE